jgi:hypothetical protein
MYEALHPYDTPSSYIKLTQINYFSLLVSLVPWDIKLVTNSYILIYIVSDSDKKIKIKNQFSIWFSYPYQFQFKKLKFVSPISSLKW